MAVGQETSVFEFGWGTGTWNEPRDSDEGWDVPASGSGVEVDARTWTFDNFGEDLLLRLRTAVNTLGCISRCWTESRIHDSLGVLHLHIRTQYANNCP